MEKKFYDLRFAAFCGETNTPLVSYILQSNLPVMRPDDGIFFHLEASNKTPKGLDVLHMNAVLTFVRPDNGISSTRRLTCDLRYWDTPSLEGSRL